MLYIVITFLFLAIVLYFLLGGADIFLYYLYKNRPENKLDFTLLQNKFVAEEVIQEAELSV